MTRRVLVFGDAHIPSRRDSIPSEFYEHITGTDYDLTLITGDLVRESDMRAALPPLTNCYIVTGNMDYNGAYNFHEQIQLDSFSLLLLHGTQLHPRGDLKQLWEILQKVEGDVAIHGHTHKAAIDLYKDRLFLNPGTVSGATGGWGGRTDASFMELFVDDTKMQVTLHLTDWRVVKTTELHYQKHSGRIERVT
jgi:vacuolar protein sorting-associated protein 29